MGCSYSWRAGEQPSLIKGGATFNSRSEHHVPVVAVTGQKATSAQARGDSLPDWLQPFTELPTEQREATVRSRKNLKLFLPQKGRTKASQRAITTGLLTFQRIPIANACQMSDDLALPKQFGAVITAAHEVVSEDTKIATSVRRVVQDFYSCLIHSYPTRNKSAGDTKKDLQQCPPHSERTGRCCTDYSLEFTRAREELMWHHDKASWVDGATQLNAIAICETFKILWPMDEHCVRNDATHRALSRSYRSEQFFFEKQSHHKTNIACITLATRWCRAYS